MRAFITSLLLTGLCLIGGRSSAQPKATFTHYTTADGLSHVAISAIMKDRQGFMWFATWDGIDRFDGNRFISYKSVPGDNSPLKTNRIDAIVEGDDDHLWLRAYDYRVYNFNKATGQLSPIERVVSGNKRQDVRYNRVLMANDHELWLQTIDQGIIYFPDVYKKPSVYTWFRSQATGRSHLPGDKISFFYKDQKQRIWVGTEKGLACIYKNAGTYVTNLNTGAANDDMTDVAEDINCLYFATASGKLYIKDKNSDRTLIKQLTTSRLNKLLISRQRDVMYISCASGALLELGLHGFALKQLAQAPGELISLFEASNGDIWIEPVATGIYRYDIALGKLKSYYQQTDNNPTFLGNHFRVFEDKNGLVWACLKKGGFGYYDKAKDELAYYYNNPTDVNRRFSNNIITFFYDQAGVLWMTTDERGLDKIVFQANDFHQYLPAWQPGFLKSENDVRGIMMDRKGRWWIGTKGSTLWLIDHGRQTKPVFVNEPAGGIGQVYAINQDATGAVWVGTKSTGLYKAVPLNAGESLYRLEHFTTNPHDPNSISSNEVYCILTDKQGRVWIGSFDGGINLVAQTGNKVRFIHQPELLNSTQGERFRRIRHMALDGAGNIWVAATDGLMIIQNHLNQAPFRFKTYNKVPGNPESLGNNDIQFVYRDHENNMWLATSGGGVSKARGNDPVKALSFRNYTTRDGLSNDYIVSLTEDKDHMIWLASQNELARFNPLTGQFRNYNAADGIIKTLFSEASAISTPDGQLIFGTMNGLLTFRPDDLADHRIPGNIAFTDLQINNEDLTNLNDPSLLTHQINKLAGLTLKHNQNTISFDYTVLDYRSSGRQSYSYRLQGFDSTWHSSRGLQRATYTNLPPGRYKFEIKCISNGLYTNTPYKSFDIEILPPAWLTWWAYLIYTVLAVLIFIAIRRNALTMLRLRQRIAVEHKLTALKTNFFTNISHELRTPLTLIVNPITAIAEGEHLSEKGKAYMAIAQKNTARMVRFINQLLDLRKVQSGQAVLNYELVELIGFVKDINDHFLEVASEKNISFSINANAIAVNCRLDAEKIDIVIYNILANAYKFSPAHKPIKVNITVEAESEQVTIAISDEGGGVAQDQLGDLFKLFYEAQHHEQKGTGIGLALSKEMVELHNGQIWAANNSDSGLTVYVRLKTEQTPVNNKPQRLVPDEREEYIGEDMHAEPIRQLILIVEDNVDLSKFLALEISSRYRVITAENGVEGLRLARTEVPDLIISDVMMPEMDGIAMLTELKKNSITSHIPVILLTAKHAIESQVEGLKYGADYYITKPFHNNFLQAAIDNIVAKRKKLFDKLIDGGQALHISPSEIIITSQDEAFIKRVIGIVEEKMVDPEFTIEEVASLMNMSRSPFYKKLKGLTHLAPVEFIREMRLKRARQYMDAGETIISDIAYKVGFQNVKYFSTCFKEYFAMSPTEYLRTTDIKATK